MRKTVKLGLSEYLVIDPCYIKSSLEGLTEIKEWYVDDGDHALLDDGKFTGAGVSVDSGRIAIFRSEQEGLELEVDSGLSGELILTPNAPIDRLSFEPYDELSLDD